MKATSKPCLYAKRTKGNGKYPVKLRVTFQRVFQFYGLGIDMTKEEFKEYHLNKKLRHLFEDIALYQKKAADVIDDLKEDFTWKEFEKRFLSKAVIVTHASKDLLEAILSYKDQLTIEERFKSAESYKCSYSALKKYIATDKLLFSAVTPEFLKGFDKYLREKEISSSTIGIYTRNIRAVYNQAIDNKTVPAELYPFGKNKYSPPSSRNVKKSLKVQEIGKIFYHQSDVEIEQWSKDMWMFAYFGNGMNIKDVSLLKYKNIVSGEIHFVRSKSKNSTSEKEKKIVVVLTDEIKDIIKKWGNKTKSPNEYIFDIAKNENSALENYKSLEQAKSTINKYMKRIGDQLGLDRNPTTNYARHSYATILKRAGVATEMISENIGHTSIKTTEIYLDSFENEQRKKITKHLTAFKPSKDKGRINQKA